MDEYIKRDDALMAISYYPIENPEPGDIIQAVLETARKAIAKINAADVATVRHGNWEWDTEDIYRCSNCTEKSHVKEVMGRPAWGYCPNCGCLMDGGDDE